MKRKPSAEATAAWIRLMRVQSRVLDAVEQDLKKAGFPPLAWYDALHFSKRSCATQRLKVICVRISSTPSQKTLPRPRPLVSGIKTKGCDALLVVRFRLLLTLNGDDMKAL